MLTANLIAIALLILATAFFVAAEFSIVKVRPSRIEQLVLEGNRSAKVVQKIIKQLDGYLSACQLGITITALGLGWLGEPTVEKLLYPLFTELSIPEQLSHTLSFIIAFGTITFLHVVLGELAPKSLAIQISETVSLLLARPLVFFYRLMYPFIWLLNGSAALLIRALGFKPVNEHGDAHSEDELRLLLSESYEKGEINQSELGYVNRIFDLDDVKAHEIMVPRMDMVCLYVDKPLSVNLRIICEEQYTRFPVVKENKDNIIGMVHTKAFFMEYTKNPNMSLSRLIRPVMTVSESMPINELFTEMQKQSSHIAILLDEYGGTAGMITIEDILEEIVGDIRDEFDTEEKSEIETLGTKHIVADGKVPVSDIVELFGVDTLDQDEFDTIGGWLFAVNRQLREGMSWTHGNLEFIVRKRDKHRFRKIEIRWMEPEVTDDTEDEKATKSAEERNGKTGEKSAEDKIGRSEKISNGQNGSAEKTADDKNGRDDQVAVPKNARGNELERERQLPGNGSAKSSDNPVGY